MYSTNNKFSFRAKLIKTWIITCQKYVYGYILSPEATRVVANVLLGQIHDVQASRYRWPQQILDAIISKADRMRIQHGVVVVQIDEIVYVDQIRIVAD